MDTNCLFCKIIAGDIPSEFVYEDEAIVAFRDINPQASTHVLVVPRKHIPRIVDATQDDVALLGNAAFRAAQIARQEGVGDNFRLIVNNGEDAGQTIFHLHFHVLGGRHMAWPPG